MMTSFFILKKTRLGLLLMKVRELVDILSELNQETEIGILDNEWDVGKYHGINDIHEIELITSGWLDANDNKEKDFEIYKIV